MTIASAEDGAKTARTTKCDDSKPQSCREGKVVI